MSAKAARSVFTVYVLLTIFVGTFGIASCNGPTPFTPIVERMTVARHNANLFPVAHGSSENPSSDCNACHGGFDSFSEFTCVECHFHRESSMDAAHANVSNYSFDSTECLSCHEGGDAFDRDEHSAFFPVSTGDTHETIGCEECHAGGDYTTFACIDCHEHSQELMAPAHADVPDYVHASENCLDCHASGLALDRDGHSQYFPISTGSNHETIDCAECHDSGTYTEFACISCHEHSESAMAPVHEDVVGYVHESNECLTCHPSGEAMDRADHDEFFPIDTGDVHVVAGCSDCHTTGSYDAFECIECHEHSEDLMVPAHSGVSAFVFDSDSCLECHSNGLAMNRADHAEFFPINTNDTHADANCSDCHTTSSYDEFTCLTCHEHEETLMATEHSQVNGYSYDSDECLDCHSDGVVITLSTHSQDFFPITSGRHSRYECVDCHQDTTTYTEFSCIACHEGAHTCSRMRNEHDDVRNFECVDESCLRCHPNGRE